MERITNKMLEMRVEMLNKITGMPLKAYTKNHDGDYVANLGNYNLYYAYGRVGIHQITTNGGGVREILFLDSKRNTFEKLCAFINGIEYGIEISKK